MNWIHSFELLCYCLALVLLVDVIRRKRISELKLFLSGCIAGFALELLAVRVTDIYHYNPAFWLNIGREPFQFPVFGGLMWGGLTVCALRIAKRLGFGKVMTALTTGFLIVSMDLILDVVAIRLDGGFWVWEGRSINAGINHHMWMSVIWVNFLGYLFETPMVTWLFLKDAEKGDARPWWKHLLASVLIAFGGVAFVGACSGLSLWLNSMTDEWFAFIAFLLLWLYILCRIVLHAGKQALAGPRQHMAMLFFILMYAYSLAAFVSLNLALIRSSVFILGFLLLAGTIYLAAFSVDRTD